MIRIIKEESRLDADVTSIEILSCFDNIGIDMNINKTFPKILIKQSLKFKFYTKVADTRKTNGDIPLDCDILFVCIGQRPYTKDLGLDSVGIKLNQLGRIEVDKNFQGTRKDIYIISDCIQGSM
ncbi:unnamed protein product [Rotaria sp. Silwood1]|nr:unnamed protein product [Rotaria sp. Silwood1]